MYDYIKLWNKHLLHIQIWSCLNLLSQGRVFNHKLDVRIVRNGYKLKIYFGTLTACKGHGLYISFWSYYLGKWVSDGHCLAPYDSFSCYFFFLRFMYQCINSVLWVFGKWIVPKTAAHFQWAMLYQFRISRI